MVRKPSILILGGENVDPRHRNNTSWKSWVVTFEQPTKQRKLQAFACSHHPTSFWSPDEKPNGVEDFVSQLKTQNKLQFWTGKWRWPMERSNPIRKDSKKP